MPPGEGMEQLDAFSALSLTKGIDLTASLRIPLLATSPAVLGFLIPAMPHLLVFTFGEGISLKHPTRFPLPRSTDHRSWAIRREVIGRPS